ncbi:MAG: hypothetical protein UU25_C0009G0008 [Microgenomates group bacterium GW2011_GWB1_40_9]|nr:MAG: hypothetical protein UU25_C0009G0008 [Microgenomates group bacterium GW2011_GWB1_40_9]
MKTAWKALVQTFGKTGVIAITLFILLLLSTLIYGAIYFPDWKTIIAIVLFSLIVFLMIWDIVRNEQQDKKKTIK